MSIKGIFTGSGESRRRESGLLLMQCLVYLSVFAIVLGLGMAALVRCWDNYKLLNRSAGDVVKALQTGERWREDVRQATGPVKLEEVQGATELHLPLAGDEVIYAFRDSAIYRKAHRNAPWTLLISAVKSSQMQRDQRTHTTSWRWELELNKRTRKGRMQPMFTFQAMPSVGAQL